MAFDTTLKQKEQIRQAARYRHFCAVGGSRSTKTFGFVHCILTRASKAGGTKHGIFRFRANAARASISLDTIPKVNRIAFPHVKLKEHRQDGFWELPNSSQIWVGGLDSEERTEKILGNEFSTLFFNECSQIPYSAVLIGLTRLAENSSLVQRAFYDLNPVGKGHWSNLMFGEKKEPRSRIPYPNPQDYGRLFMNPVDNPHLSPEYLASMQNLPERQRKRFYEGVYVDEVDGALWSYEIIEQSRKEFDSFEECRAFMKRICVAVDPSGAKDTDNEDNDEIGIIVTGIGIDGYGYVLDDVSIKAGPGKWGRAAVNAYNKWTADCIIAESNFGGEMVRFVINTADRNVPVRLVNASRGKTVRAEPVSSLYEKNKVRHAGRFPLLEDQMAAWALSGYTGEGSPDRADAMVWGITYLMLKLDGGSNLIEFYRMENEAAGRRLLAAADAGPQQPPPGTKTVQDLMIEDAQRAMAQATLGEKVRALTTRKPKGRAKPEPVTPVNRSSFYDVATATGRDGAPDAPPPTTKPTIVRVDDHTIHVHHQIGSKRT